MFLQIPNKNRKYYVVLVGDMLNFLTKKNVDLIEINYKNLRKLILNTDYSVKEPNLKMSVLYKGKKLRFFGVLVEKVEISSCIKKGYVFYEEEAESGVYAL